MINYNTLGNNLKREILRFSEKISKGFLKPTRRFIADMIFGSITAKSSQLTDIGRALKEPIALKKTVERLGRNLSDFTERDALMRNYLAAVKPALGPDTMLLIDGGDMTKPHSPKMEAIGTVRDGSTGLFADGYWTMAAVALSDEYSQAIPVYENIYPCKKQGGLGFNAETIKCLESLRLEFDRVVTRVLDRGFDSGDVILNLTEHGENFILRVNQNRVVIHNGKRKHINDIVHDMVCDHEFSYRAKDGEGANCKIGITQVVLPRVKHTKLNLIVCKGYGDESLVLYTNLSETLENIAVRAVKAYLMRWRIEEYYAFKKQALGLEDFRVRSLNSIKNIDLLLTIAVGFLGVFCEKSDTKTILELIFVSKRIETPIVYMKKTKFLFYALLDGITTVLASLRCGISHHFKPTTRDYQLCLPGCEILG